MERRTGLSGLKSLDCPLTSASSSRTRGGDVLVSCKDGLTKTSPLTVEKQIKPPRVFRPAGQKPLEHSSADIPSSSPNTRGCTKEIWPPVNSFSSRLTTRKIPWLQPSQRSP